jgi:intein/homing endonuclease
MAAYSNEEMHKELIEDKVNYSDLAKKYGITRPTVRAYAKRLGLHKGNTKRLKSHTLNLSYFDKIDTPSKAYILGFIYADGCNTRSGLQIGIQENDKEVLDFIKKELGISNELRYIKPYKDTWKAKWELSVKSIDLSKSLTNVGCPPAKSLILEFPSFIPDDLMSHFIRGYFDGDGCLFVNKKGYFSLSFISGSKAFIDGLSSYISQKTGVSFNRYEGKAYSIFTGKQAAVKSILNYIYTDSEFSMERKYKKACLLINTP